MVQLSSEGKQAIVLQAINRGSKSIGEIARLNNVGLSSVQKWLKVYREGGSLERDSKSAVKTKLNKDVQFGHLVETHNLDATALGEYCRKHGLYSHELASWREEMMSSKQEVKQSVELKQLKKENNRLECELRRKEKALAEACALLILKKKADLIWGASEDG